jgi:hypothetical protein
VRGGGVAGSGGEYGEFEIEFERVGEGGVGVMP